MKAEIDRIKKRVDAIKPLLPLLREEICRKKLNPHSRTYITDEAKILSTSKVRLENLLCETDLKERDHLNRLLFGILRTVA